MSTGSSAEPIFELAEGQPSEHTLDGRLAELPDLQEVATLETESSVPDELQHAEFRENKVAIVSMIIPFSIAGTLIRIGLTRLQTYDGQPVFALVYAQWIGCFIMGMVVQNKMSLFEWYLPLQVGLSTGLCGSITTFSSWQRDIFAEFSNYSQAPHTRGENVLAALSQFIVTLAMSLNGLLFGYHVGKFVEPTRHKVASIKGLPREIKIIPEAFALRHLCGWPGLSLLVSIACWIGVVFAAIFALNQRNLAFACVFSPVGALLRYFLSVFNINKCKNFPFGTLTANLLGTAILAALTLVESGVTVTPLTCDVILGLADGFCGCLTTISTFVVELSNLPFRTSYFYGFISIVVAQCFFFVIEGTYIWTHGVHVTCH